jgi:hypothetical protein
MIFWKARGYDPNADINTTQYDCRHSGWNSKTNRRNTKNNQIESTNKYGERIDIGVYYNIIMCLWQQKFSKSTTRCTTVAALFTCVCVYILFPKREKATRTRTVNARLTCVGCSGVRCWRNPRRWSVVVLSYTHAHMFSPILQLSNLPL